MSNRATSPPVEQGTIAAAAPKRFWRELGTPVYVKAALLACLLGYLFRHELGQLVRMWLNDPSWSHGFLIPLFSLYFVNQKKSRILALQYVDDPLAQLLRGRAPQRLQQGQTRPNYLGLILLVAAIAFYVFNWASPSGYAYFRSLSVIAAIGSVVLFLGGWRLVRHVWLPVFFLIFAVPLPDRYYVSMTMPMRKLAAQVTTTLLNLASGMEASVSGTVIDVIYRGQPMDPPLNVEEACSGMRLLLAFLALGVAMAYLHDRPIWQRLVLLASTIPIAVLCNVVRVTVTGFIYVFIHPKYTQGVYHDMLGFAMLPLAFAIYAFLGWFMSSLFVEEPHAAVPDVVVRRSKP